MMFIVSVGNFGIETGFWIIYVLFVLSLFASIQWFNDGGWRHRQLISAHSNLYVCHFCVDTMSPCLAFGGWGNSFLARDARIFFGWQTSISIESLANCRCDASRMVCHFSSDELKWVRARGNSVLIILTNHDASMPSQWRHCAKIK